MVAGHKYESYLPYGCLATKLQDGRLGLPVPALLTAHTLNSYSLPSCNPLTASDVFSGPVSPIGLNLVPNLSLRSMM